MDCGSKVFFSRRKPSIFGDGIFRGWRPHDFAYEKRRFD